MQMPVSGTVQVGLKYSVEITIDAAGHLTCMWSPHTPERGGLSKDEVRAYQAGRNKLLEEFAIKTGKRILLIE